MDQLLSVTSVTNWLSKDLEVEGGGGWASKENPAKTRLHSRLNATRYPESPFAISLFLQRSGCQLNDPTVEDTTPVTPVSKCCSKNRQYSIWVMENIQRQNITLGKHFFCCCLIWRPTFKPNCCQICRNEKFNFNRTCLTPWSKATCQHAGKKLYVVCVFINTSFLNVNHSLMVYSMYLCRPLVCPCSERRFRAFLKIILWMRHVSPYLPPPGRIAFHSTPFGHLCSIVKMSTNIASTHVRAWVWPRLSPFVLITYNMERSSTTVSMNVWYLLKY